MSGTRRTPLARRPAVQITPRAVELFAAMGRLRCTCAPPPPERASCPGCQRWYDLHAELHAELGCKPWEWPCVARQSPKRAGSTCMSESVAATMALLQDAVRRRAAASARGEAERDAIDQPAIERT
jgi:hypothetical protein